AMDPRPSKEDADKKIHEVAKMLQMDHLLERKVDQLSGGQKQRVSLARCMVRSPQVFLFDEPLSHVDAKIRHSMRTELHRLSSVLATTTIYVTHDYVEALSLADRIVVIDKGVIQQIGTPHAIYDTPANEFVARVVGQPNINILNCQVIRKGDEIFLQNPGYPEIAFKPTKKDAEIIESRNLDVLHVGIRPQDVRYSLTPINHQSIQCSAKLYELWGRRGMIMVNIGGEDLRILTNSDVAVHIGQPIWLNLNDSHLYLFDQSGSKLGGSEA
ncbi:MAG TPA: ABC transporter ATP-binding protein, partial [Leptolinea sp.]